MGSQRLAGVLTVGSGQVERVCLVQQSALRPCACVLSVEAFLNIPCARAGKESSSKKESVPLILARKTGNKAMEMGKVGSSVLYSTHIQ